MSDARFAPAAPAGTRGRGVDVIVLAKAFARAKTRLSGWHRRDRARLSQAMLRDTVDVVAPLAHAVAVVSDQPGLDALVGRWGHDNLRTVEDVGHDLNAAVRAADAALGPAPYQRLRLAMVADLPCLRRQEFEQIVHAASQVPHWLVIDADGGGTTMLGSAQGPLGPHFGPGSAHAHQAAGAVPLVGAWPGARRDVDTADDVELVLTLGVGPATRAALDWIQESGGDGRGARSAPGPSV